MKKEIEAMGENWYQRAHKLMAIVQDETKPEKYRAKAARLFTIMFQRLTRFVGEYQRAQQARFPNFPKGGK